MELAKLPRNRVPERADWAKLSGSWTSGFDERIAELERLEAGLTECIGCGCLSLDRCQLSDHPAIAPAAVARPSYLSDSAADLLTTSEPAAVFVRPFGLANVARMSRHSLLIVRDSSICAFVRPLSTPLPASGGLR